eukprot:NODE_7219_length_412_cov_102.380165_g5578_i0.p1 GENE.NODE_7219_length_412_cov_102.380165_g5578_i0~~NODE_7219_length_412_cov_102.380165_g5578_i0.p1  ORF type:complete len:127 (-),score=18.32 NODE_7219_length_412_cov_102.380165_g5578_i0:31-387(-)
MGAPKPKTADSGKPADDDRLSEPSSCSNARIRLMQATTLLAGWLALRAARPFFWAVFPLRAAQAAFGRDWCDCYAAFILHCGTAAFMVAYSRAAGPMLRPSAGSAAGPTDVPRLRPLH